MGTTAQLVEFSAEPIDITGEIHTWNSGGVVRRWIEVVIPYGRFRGLVDVERYDPATGEGYQREDIAEHVVKLASAIKTGEYAPVQWHLSLTDWHAERLVEKGRKATVSADLDHPLSIDDGQHRYLGLERLWADPEFGPEKLKDLPVSLHIALGADPVRRARDFAALQQGKAVSANLKASLRLQSGTADPLARKAYEVARKLDAHKSSHLHKVIDWTGSKADKVAVASLVAEGKSTRAGSLYGGVVLAGDHDADWIAKRYVDVWKALKTHGRPYNDEEPATSDRRILRIDRPLCPIGSGGSRYGSHLLIVLGNCLIHRLVREGKDKPDEEGLKRIVATAEALFDLERGDTSAPARRADAERFARKYFEDLPTREKVKGVPIALADVLGSSIVKLEPGTKLKPNAPMRGRGRPPGSKNKPKVEELPDGWIRRGKAYHHPETRGKVVQSKTSPEHYAIVHTDGHITENSGDINDEIEIVLEDAIQIIKDRWKRVADAATNLAK